MRAEAGKAKRKRCTASVGGVVVASASVSTSRDKSWHRVPCHGFSLASPDDSLPGRVWPRPREAWLETSVKATTRTRRVRRQHGAASTRKCIMRRVRDALANALANVREPLHYSESRHARGTRHTQPTSVHIHTPTSFSAYHGVPQRGARLPAGRARTRALHTSPDPPPLAEPRLYEER